jgi:geranylgeranyl reductase family protein
MQNKTIIVGAGTAGLILASELASKGIDVEVFEADKEIGQHADKASGILSIEGLKLLGIDYSDAVVNSLKGAIVYGRKEAMSLNAKKLMAYVLDRKLLAKILYREAVAAGADVRLGHRLGRKEIIELGNESIIVGADGAVSNVASAFDFPKIQKYILTYKAEYENATIPDSSSVELFFSGGSKRFFGWTAPYSKSTLEIGIGEWMGERRDSYSLFSEFIKTPKINVEIENARRSKGLASLIPISPRKKTVKKNVLLVGDAAGQVKATTGGGIIFGALCAKTAAECIINNINKGTPLSNYERLWRKRYGVDLALHAQLHRYYSTLGSRGIDMMIKMSRTFGIDRFLEEHGDMDRPSLIIKRFFYKNSVR